MKTSISRTLVGLLAAAGLVGASVNAQAATATGNFNVNITLTSKCEINSTAAATGAVISDIALAYTSFQTTAATGSTNFNVRCTTSLPYALALDTTTITDDALNLDYPNTGAGQLNTAPLDIQVGVQTSCLLDKPLPGLTVAYTSLQSMAAILNTSVLLRCSTGHPWTAGLLPDPASAAAPVTTLTNQSLLGLTYSVQVSPASGTGTGNAAGGGQAVTLGVTVPGGQAGICSMGSCTASNTHVLVITF